MFKILSTHPTPEVLDSATQIIQKAQTIRSNALDVALYDSAKIFVTNGPLAKNNGGVVAASGSDNKDTSSASDTALATERSSALETSEVSDEPLERFQPLVMAVVACPLEPWRQPERSRRSRADLALAFAQRGPQDPAALAAILDPWLAEERSRPLREDLERARQACKRLL